MEQASKRRRLRALKLADKLVRRIEKRKKPQDEPADHLLSAIRDVRVGELAEGSPPAPPGSPASDVHPPEDG